MRCLPPAAHHCADRRCARGLHRALAAVAAARPCASRVGCDADGAAPPSPRAAFALSACFQASCGLSRDGPGTPR
eukprot:7311957-Pyramimonas_sp.AAC.1